MFMKNVRYKNISAEIAREGYKFKEIAQALEISNKAFSNRVNGKTDFKAHEAIVLKIRFFPNLSLDYLFDREVG